MRKFLLRITIPCCLVFRYYSRWFITVAIHILILTAASAPAPHGGAYAYESGDCSQIETVTLKGGTFTLGYKKSIFIDETSDQEEIVSSFRISKYEITKSQFLSWIVSNGIQYDNSRLLSIQNYKLGCLPINFVDWHLAKAFCKSEKGRLPTEAEWEYAASIDEGSESAKRIWSSGNIYPEIQSKKPTGCSSTQSEVLYDQAVDVHCSLKGANDIHGMTGNLWEWTQDWYSVNKKGGYLDLMDSTNKKWKVIRGGGHQNVRQEELMETTSRNRLNPKLGHEFVGFRCVWDN